jgi:DNA repair exonuclease SbcCD ATPase subunit
MRRWRRSIFHFTAGSMQITRLFAENFLSFKALDLPLKDRGLVVVEGENNDQGGSNGSGKSSIFEALVWCLFGCTTRGVRSSDVVRRDRNWNSVGNCSVVVEVELDGSRLLVARYREHKKFNNKLLLVLDGNDITMGSDKETQLRVCELLQIDFDSFIAAVLYPQGAGGFPSLSDGSQKEILEKLIAAGRFAKALVLAKERIAPLRKAISEFDVGIASLRTLYRELETSIVSFTTQSQLWATNHAANLAAFEIKVAQLRTTRPSVDESLIASLAMLEAELHQFSDTATTQTNIAKLLKARSDLNRQIGVIEGKIESQDLFLQSQKPTTKVEDTGLTLVVARNNVAIARKKVADCNRELDSAQMEKTVSERTYAALSEAANCPQCQQQLPEGPRKAARESVQEKIALLDLKVAGCRDKLNVVSQELEVAEKLLKETEAFDAYAKRVQSIADVQKEQESNKARIPVLTLEAAAIEAKQQELQVEYDKAIVVKQKRDTIATSLKGQQVALTHFEQILKQQEQQLEAAKLATDPYIEFKKQAEARIAATLKTMRWKEALRKEAETQLKMLEVWEVGFGNQGVKSLLFDTITPYLSYQANDYLSQLSNGTAGMRFNTQVALQSGATRDKFNVEVLYNCGANSYDNLSGGERRRVDIACLLALGDLGASRSLAPINLRLLDEPFDNLDSVGAESVLGVLQREILPKAGTVLVVTHDDNLKSLIADRITVRKQNGISVVV